MWPRIDVKKLAERRARSRLQLTDEQVEQIVNWTTQIDRRALESFRAYVQCQAWISASKYERLQELKLLDDGGEVTRMGRAFHVATQDIPPQLFADE